MEKDLVTISRDEYASLLTDSLKLNALKCGGVDNWEWYGDSLYDWRREFYKNYPEDVKPLIKRCEFGSSYDEEKNDEEDFFMECVEYKDIAHYLASLK